MLTQRDDLAVDRYLDLVADARTRSAALKALSKISNPPTDRMLAR
jgi:hypothetical protein